MEPHIQRRLVLGAGAAVAAGIMGPALLRPAQAAAATQAARTATTATATQADTAAAARPALQIGSNANWFAAVHAAVPATACRRVYYPDYNFVPEQWPPGPVPSAAMVSLRPVPRDLLAGRLDAQLRTFLESAPPGSHLNAWHEAGNLAGYPAFITPPAMREVHTYLHRLCQGTSVRYGPILCMPPSSMWPWLVGGLDWYGLDIYDWPQFQTRDGHLDIKGKLYPRLDQWRSVIQRVTGQRSPVLSICETNSIVPAHRPRWFTGVARWLSANGGRHMLTYWSASPGAVGPWLPHDAGVIRALAGAAALPQ